MHSATVKVKKFRFLLLSAYPDVNVSAHYKIEWLLTRDLPFIFISAKLPFSICNLEVCESDHVG